jgi:hypothetical protein
MAIAKQQEKSANKAKQGAQQPLFLQLAANPPAKTP